MSSIRFFLLFLFLTAICFSPVTARADSIIPGLSGSLVGCCGGQPAFTFYADDGTTSSWNSMINPSIPSDHWMNNPCNPIVSPCYATWSGGKVGMYVSLGFTNIFNGVVTQGQYSGYVSFDGYSFMEEESGWFDFVGTWDGLNPAWIGKGSISYGLTVQCGFSGCDFPGYTLSGNIVTTIAPEPSSFVLICTGVLGFAGAMRRRIQP